MSALTSVKPADGPVLIVEDDFFIAQELLHAFEATGAQIAGPIADLASATRLVETQRVGLAVLDINVGGDMIFPLASALRSRAVPMVFATGFGTDAVPREFADVPLIEKPFNAPEVARALLKGPLPRRAPQQFANGLLTLLPKACLDEARRHVSLTPLRAGDTLHRAGARIEHVWFIESGMCVLSPRAGSVDVGMIGREGAIGIEALIGAPHATMHCVVAGSGSAVRIGAAGLRKTLEHHHEAGDLLLRYLLALHAQTASTVQSASMYDIRARVARWLTMACDRIGSDLPVTHEILADFICVRRAGVTEALHELEAAGAIERRRGRVLVRQRALLQTMAQGYGAAERAYERLLTRQGD